MNKGIVVAIGLLSVAAIPLSARAANMVPELGPVTNGRLEAAELENKELHARNDQLRADVNMLLNELNSVAPQVDPNKLPWVAE